MMAASTITFLGVFIKETTILNSQYPRETYPDGIPKEALAEWARTVVPILVAIAAVAILIGIVFLVFYIISIVGASSLEDKIAFILLIVGFFFSIVGVIGLFVLISTLNTEEQKRKEKQQQNNNIFV